MLITDPEEVGQPRIGEQQHVVAGALQQSIGGHRGSQPELVDQGLVIPLLPKQGLNGLHSRITGSSWLF